MVLFSDAGLIDKSREDLQPPEPPTVRKETQIKRTET
jgi:hypothetical protein